MRVTLVNRETGGQFPEATLVEDDPIFWVVRFDGTPHSNSFNKDDWGVVKGFQEFDVVRRADRDRGYCFLVHQGGQWFQVNTDSMKVWAVDEKFVLDTLDEKSHDGAAVWELV